MYHMLLSGSNAEGVILETTSDRSSPSMSSCPGTPSSAETQTDKSLSASTPCKLGYRRILKQVRSKNDRLKLVSFDEITLNQYQQLTHKFCASKDLANFINTQVE